MGLRPTRGIFNLSCEARAQVIEFAYLPSSAFSQIVKNVEGGCVRARTWSISHDIGKALSYNRIYPTTPGCRRTFKYA